MKAINQAYVKFLAVNTAYDGLLDSRVARTADRAMQGVDSETVALFRKYKVRVPGDFSLMSWARILNA